MALRFAEGSEGCPSSEFREILFEIWAPSPAHEISTKFGPDSAFRPLSNISRKFCVAIRFNFLENFSKTRVGSVHEL